MFLKRRGDGAFSDIDSLWGEIHSPQTIGRMKSLGINLSHIHFHKGYGLEAEADSIREAIEWAKELHRNNIAVGVYIGSTFFRETFEHPQYEDMIMQDVKREWSPAQYFRDPWCYNSPIVKEYFKEVIRIAIEEVQADVLHFDTAFASRVDNICHCQFCLKGFREFLRNDSPKLNAIAGYDDNPNLLQPPPNGNLEYLATLDEVREPGLMAWVLFRAQSGYKALKEFVEYAKSLKSDILIFYNGAQGAGITRFSYTDMSFEKLKLVELSCTEDCIENPIGITEEEMPISRFRAYKMANQTRTRHCYYTVTQGRNNKLMLAEAAAFNYMCLGFVETGMQKTHRLESKEDEAFLSYIVENEQLFMNQNLLANIAVLHHHESMLLNPFASNLTPLVVEQMLFENHFPFTIIGSEELIDNEYLKNVDLLVLPDSKCLSDEQIIVIEKFVSNGGKLLSIGRSGSADEYNQYRSKWGLHRIFQKKKHPVAPKLRYQEIAYSEAELNEEMSKSEIFNNTFGQGQAIHIAGMNFKLPDDSKLNTFGGHRWFYHPYWVSPHNAEQFVSAIKSLLADCFHIETNLPRYVGVEYYTVKDDILRLHIVNFAYPKRKVQDKFIAIISPKLTNAEYTVVYYQQGKVENKSVSFVENELKIPLSDFELLLSLEIQSISNF